MLHNSVWCFFQAPTSWPSHPCSLSSVPGVFSLKSRLGLTCCGLGYCSALHPRCIPEILVGWIELILVSVLLEYAKDSSVICDSVILWYLIQHWPILSSHILSSYSMSSQKILCCCTSEGSASLKQLLRSVRCGHSHRLLIQPTPCSLPRFY